MGKRRRRPNMVYLVVEAAPDPHSISPKWGTASAVALALVIVAAAAFSTDSIHMYPTTTLPRWLEVAGSSKQDGASTTTEIPAEYAAPATTDAPVEPCSTAADGSHCENGGTPSGTTFDGTSGCGCACPQEWTGAHCEGAAPDPLPPPVVGEPPPPPTPTPDVFAYQLLGAGSSIMGKYRVLADAHPTLRDGFEYDSDAVGALEPGAVVGVLETRVNSDGVTRMRTRVGWVSLSARDGRVMLALESDGS